jgi:predicted permease
MTGAVREWWERSLGFLRGRRTDAGLDAEIEAHIEMAIADNLRSGMSPEEARRQAALKFGSHLSAREEAGDQSGLPALESFLQDLRYAIRGMRKSPAFTSIAVLTLALGIGANTALFSLVESVLLRHLPVRDPDSLYFLENAGAKGPNGGPPYEVYESFRDHTGSFEGMAAHMAEGLTLRIGGHVEQVWGEYASGAYFQVLGVGAALGRVLIASDDRLQPPVAVLNYAYWQTRFGGDPAVIGKTISIDQGPLTIVGVAEPGFTGIAPGLRSGITVPFTELNPSRLKGMYGFLNIVARIKPGVSASRARSEIDPIFQNFMKPHVDFSPELRRDYFDHMELLPAAGGDNAPRARFAEPLIILMALVGVVLVVGCSNLANLFMARAASREREFAVRLAIGAGWRRLARQLVTETTLLFGCGAAAGLALAIWGSHLLAGFLAVGRTPLFIEPRLDTTVLVFTAGITLLAGLVFGVAPTLMAARANPQAALHGLGGRTTDSRLRAGVRHTLVVAQVALSLALLVGGGLFVRTLANLNRLDLGFRPQGVLTMRVSPAGSGYTNERLDGIWAGLPARVKLIPGVAAASVSVLTPLSGRDRGVRVRGVAGFEMKSGIDEVITQNHVSENYFAAFGIPLVAGRTFTVADSKDAPQVAIVNEAAARVYFGGRSAIGATIELGTGAQRRVCEIVGVVRDARHMTLRQEIPKFIYLPVAQRREHLGQLTLAVRTAGNPARVAAKVEQEVRALGPDILVTEVMTLQQQVDATIVQERLLGTVGGFFSVLALVLSAVGLYGLLAHVVGQRTGEIGIRMALGATRLAVVWMILRRSLWLVVIGVAAGIPAALWAVRPLGSLLYGLEPTDTSTVAMGVLVLIVTAMLASYIPARRASSIDPITALRNE